MHGNLLALSSTADIAEIFHSFARKEQRAAFARADDVKRPSLRTSFRAANYGIVAATAAALGISIYFAES